MAGKFTQWVFGQSKDPLDKRTKKHIALSAFLAWVGLGADGLSSACYGPQEAFLALGPHPSLALYLALAMAITVFIISFAYNQVISLFPNGGGGYKVATDLLGPYSGLVAGSALLVDYTLTIVISIASGGDALFSLFPTSWLGYKLHAEMVAIFLLMMLNLRGMKEAIKVLLPIFIGFVITHVFFIAYGIFRHGEWLPHLVANARTDSFSLMQSHGLIFVLAIFLHAYSVGGGTYTGLEAVSNNVNMLQSPRKQTGRLTMLFMAISLSLVAAGILFLYMLWHVTPVHGQTLNAVVFKQILYDSPHSAWLVPVTLIFEFGLLFVGANTGFMGGPAVLANMAMNKWVPTKFANLSSQLVNQNGIILFGFAAILLLVVCKGHVGTLVILYSANVFLAFSLSILGLCKHWITQRGKGFIFNFLLAFVALVICVSIFSVIIVTRFDSGGAWALMLPLVVIVGCVFIRHHYESVEKRLKEVDKLLVEPQKKQDDDSLVFDNDAMTAVFFLGQARGLTIHSVMWVLRLFPNVFKNFIFVATGTVDLECYNGEKKLQELQDKTAMQLGYFSDYAKHKGFPVKTIATYGTDPSLKALEVAEKIIEATPNCMFFASELVVRRDTWFLRQLHNNLAFSIQRRLYLTGQKMLILPMVLD